MSFRVDNLVEETAVNDVVSAPNDTKLEITYPSLLAGGSNISSNIVLFNDVVELFADDLKRQALNGIGVDMSGAGVNDFLSLGTAYVAKDTADYARNLMTDLGILEVGATVILRMNYVKNGNAVPLRFSGGSTTTNHLQFKLFGGAAGTEVVLGLASAVAQYGEIVIVVQCNNATYGAEQVEFNCVKQATPAP